MNPPVTDSFEKLLESFLDSLGHDPLAGKGSRGFEFQSGDFTVRVFSDSSEPERIVVEADVRPLEATQIDNAPLLLMLHRLNEAARTAHFWSSTIDEKDLLLLSTSLPLVGGGCRELARACFRGVGPGGIVGRAGGAILILHVVTIDQRARRGRGASRLPFHRAGLIQKIFKKTNA